MKASKTYILQLLALLLLPMISSGQQEPQFTQYMYNTISINPAFAGYREFLVINILNRNQWVGIDGAPVTQTFSAHSLIPGTKLGVGLSVINDKLGYEKNTNASLDVSYTINLSKFEEYRLSFGFKAGASRYDIDQSLINDPIAGNDPFFNNVSYKWNPNFGAGLYFRSESAYIGFSVPKLINYVNNTDLEYVDLNRVSYYINGGYLFDKFKNVKIKPTFLLKYTNGAPFSADFTANAFINEQLWLALMYRTNDSFGALANFKIVDGIFIGYAYDFVTSGLNPYTSGSHEVLLNFKFNFPKPKCKCKDLY